MSDANTIHIQTISRNHDVLGRKLKGSWDPGVVLNSSSNSVRGLGIEKNAEPLTDHIDSSKIMIYDTKISWHWLSVKCIFIGKNVILLVNC